MYCNYCGTALGAQTVCPTCGRPAPTAMTPTPAVARVAGHVRTLAILWFVVAAMWAVPAIFLFSLGTAAGVALRGSEQEFARWGGAALFYVLGGVLLLIAAVSFAAAWGLLKLRPWARVLALIMGIISLFHPPLGTALGIYTLWVLLPGAAGDEYQRLAATSS